MNFTTEIIYKGRDYEADVFTHVIPDTNPTEYKIKVIVSSLIAGDKYIDSIFEIEYIDLKRIYTPLTTITTDNTILYNTVIEMLDDNLGDLWGWTANS